MDPDRTSQVTAIAALAEPTRRQLYDHVVGRAEPVSRDDAAGAVGIPRATAAFHLDRLVDDGLLAAVYERRSGRTGPGAGRPAKLYRRAEGSVSVSLPERRYDLAGGLLSAAVAESERSGARPGETLDRIAAERGRDLGGSALTAGAVDGRDAVLHVLRQHGFEPRPEADGVVLVNCPFHTLAQDDPDLICGMNLRLLEGVLDGVPGTGWAARLRPAAGSCCVRIGPVDAPH